MKLKKIVQLTEIVGGVGILVSLIILIFEVRENSRLLERQISMDRVNARNEGVINSPYLPGIITKIKEVDGTTNPEVKAFMERYSLTHEEAQRIVRHIVRQWEGYEADFHARSTEVAEIISLSLTWPDHRLFWESANQYFDNDFVEFVNNVEHRAGADQSN
jgi:hypothetical protein